MAAAIKARVAAPAMERRVNFMDKTFTRTRRPSGRAPGSREFDVKFFSGNERIRLPVALKNALEPPALRRRSSARRCHPRSRHSA